MSYMRDTDVRKSAYADMINNTLVREKLRYTNKLNIASPLRREVPVVMRSANNMLLHTANKFEKVPKFEIDDVEISGKEKEENKSNDVL